jgi:hypothetical protein
LLNKNLYYLILITILLCISIDISYYNYIALGKEDESNDVDNVGEKEKEADDNRDNDVREDKEQEEDFEDVSLDELFDDNNDVDDNRDSKDNNVREEEKEEEADDVPFILPFKAVPFP